MESAELRLLRHIAAASWVGAIAAAVSLPVAVTALVVALL